MTTQDTTKLFMVIQAAYPNYKSADKAITISTWTNFLKDFDYEDVMSALKAFIFTDTSGFAPSVGQLIAMMNLKENEVELNETEAWALVSRALSNGSYGAEEEFKALPELVRKAVGTATNLRNWAQTDIKSVENVIQSNFMRVYRAELEKAKTKRKLPEEVRQKLLGEDNIRLLNS